MHMYVTPGTFSRPWTPPGDIGIAASRRLLMGGRLAILVTGHV